MFHFLCSDGQGGGYSPKPPEILEELIPPKPAEEFFFVEKFNFFYI